MDFIYFLSSCASSTLIIYIYICFLFASATLRNREELEEMLLVRFTEDNDAGMCQVEYRFSPGPCFHGSNVFGTIYFQRFSCLHFAIFMVALYIFTRDRSNFTATTLQFG